MKKKILILGIIMSLLLTACGNDKKKEDTSKETKPAIEETKETKQDKEDIDFTTAELTEDNIKKVAEKIFNGEVTNITIENNDIDITYYKSSLISAKSEVKENAKKTIKFLEQIYKNPNVNEVWISETADIINEKGAETQGQIIGFNTNKEKVEGADWENMYSLVSSDYEKITGIAVGYTFSPAIASELK